MSDFAHNLAVKLSQATSLDYAAARATVDAAMRETARADQLVSLLKTIPC
jgi:hypothetical protein